MGRLECCCHCDLVLVDFNSPVSWQEFNIQKLQQLDAEKARIRKEYEKKESSGDAKKKMYVFAFYKVNSYTFMAPVP